MATMKTFVLHTCGLGMALALAGCGAALEDLAEQLDEKERAKVPALDAGATAAIAEYCDVPQPGPATSPAGEWSQRSLYQVVKNGMSFMATAVTSSSGAWDDWGHPVWMTVDAFDNRDRTTPHAVSDNEERKMGVSFPISMPVGALACLGQVAKVTSSGQQARLSWSSFWNQPLPMATLPGKAVDGFEFLSNFAPASGEVLFRASKDRFASTQGLSICHLAPHQQQWNCSLPNSQERGDLWQLTQAGPRTGVYMLIAQ